MLYYFFALLTAALILLFNNPRSETNRWAAFFLGCASIGGLSGFLLDVGLETWSYAAQFLNLTLTPYGVLLFSVVYAESVSSAKVRLVLKLLLLLPVLVTLAATTFSPVFSINYVLLFLWTAPYYLVSCFLHLAALWREENRRRKQSRLVTSIIIVPTLLAVLILINVGKVISPEFEPFGYVSVFIFYSMAVALLCTFAFGVLGVKLRFERDSLESTMKAVSSGTTMLNHTIKNEIGKIAISTENLKHFVPPEDEQSKQHLQIISNASAHMLAMVTRIHSQMKDIVLREEPCLLDQLIDECVCMHQRLLDDHRIKVKTYYLCRPAVVCDKVHIKEVIGNLLTNAVEAMPAEGTINIRLDNCKKGIALSVQDTGKGIPKDQLTHVFDPFYSTKNHSRNFGLGLSYVYNVMQKSGGSVEISSREHEGTRITLLFSRKKTVQP
ncbi:sensor histidine kinase [Paenibacillus abyssi]|uniref:histidine kinase n=1 Tax=Paenibacillus abyssi TaxID=1340531 RepID=A0A917CUJ3_9BACL|nr:HAMP domain-containing sensor histidine kinase [Paenibacillus abyssi]GGF98216.1 hypothetical protein GCM10010916_14320 [Paenibacillus abyssi]